MNWRQFRIYLLQQMDSRESSGSISGDFQIPSEIQINSSIDKSSVSTVVNPAFYDVNISNPLVQHFLNDKVSDFQRGLVVAEAWNVGTLPMLYFGPQMILPKIGISIGGSIATISYLNTLDMYRDAFDIVSTRQIHGHRLFGHRHH